MNYTEKNKLMDQLCGIGLMVIFLGIFFSMVNTGFTSNFSYLKYMKLILDIAGGVFLVIAVSLLIYAYVKQGNGRKAVCGIEFLVLAFVSLILPYTYSFLDSNHELVGFTYPFNKLNIVFPILFAVYYIIKTIVVISKSVRKK